MYYLDTSVLVAYYCPEKISDRVEQILINESNPAISQLTEVELASAITRKIKENEMSREAGISVLSLFRTHIEQKSYSHFPVLANHYSTALKWIIEFMGTHRTEDPFALALENLDFTRERNVRDNTSLRVIDALHLAVAASNKATFLTTDKKVAESAKKVGVFVELIT